MGIITFWALVAAVWLFFRLTTRPQRRGWLHSGWAVLLIAGAAGFLWEQFY